VRSVGLARTPLPEDTSTHRTGSADAEKGGPTVPLCCEAPLLGRLSITILLTAGGAWSAVFGISSFGFVAGRLVVVITVRRPAPTLNVRCSLVDVCRPVALRFHTSEIWSTPPACPQMSLAVTSADRPRGVSGRSLIHDAQRSV
jgi:hypothetical protein